MSSFQPPRLLLAVPFVWFVVYAPIAEASIDDGLVRKLKHLAPHEEVSVIVTMKGAAQAEAYQVRSRNKRDGRLLKAMKSQAKLSHAGIKKHLKSRQAKKLKEFWIINGLAVTIRADQVEELAAQPGVESVRYDEVVTFAAPLPVTVNLPPEWNLTAVGIPNLWAAGQTGAGVVVATMDTGLDVSHPDLAGKWRGGNNSWFDPHGQHADPYDAAGHGTQVMGLLVGGNASGYRIGAAPDAKFIAAKIFNDAGQSTYSDIHAAFQWLIDPDNNPDTQDAPDVVNASWGLPGTNNKCNVEFDNDIRALKAAGIAVVFAGGNDGPAPATGVSPASSAGVISTGAVDSALDVAIFSSRGPSPCGGGIFPTLVAPGESIFTTDVSSGGQAAYTIVSGSSFATSHVAGILALLAGKFPGLSVTDLEAALTQTTQDLGVPGADNNFGLGLLNAGAAMQALNNRPAGSTPQITSLPPTVAMVGVFYNYLVAARDADGGSLSYTLDNFPVGMSIDATGKIFWVPGSNQAGQYLVTVRVTDSSGLYVTQPYIVEVAGLNDAPVANDDIYEMLQSTTLTVLADGVLSNDTDKNNDRLVAVNFSDASVGTVTGNQEGSFVFYPPNPAFVGIATFTYQASDGGLTSAAATVTIKVVGSEAGTLTVPEKLPTNVVSNLPATSWQYPQVEEGAKAVEDTSGDETKVADVSKPESTQGEGGTPQFTSKPNTAATQGMDYTYQVAAITEDGGSLAFDLDAAPKGMSISEDGEISWIPTSTQIGDHQVVVRVTSMSKSFSTQSYIVEVANVNDAPVAISDSFTLLHGSKFRIAAPGVLKNDTDADSTPLTVVSYGQASTGTLMGNPDGSFAYKPPTPSFTGTATFVYKASDGELTSDETTVTIDVISNREPLAMSDTFTVSARMSGLPYSPRPFRVLNNDTDPDTEFDPDNKIDPASLTIVAKPEKGGSVKVTKRGEINYIPAVNFKGFETFSYNVSDTRKVKSRTVVVKIIVK